MKHTNKQSIDTCPPFSRIEYSHTDGTPATGYRRSWWGGWLLDRDCANHRVQISTDLGRHWVPMGDVSFISVE